ncbi:hypothetical protein J437_LFUL013055 [Ladona fulva]|uniref:Uncharacterized protein n=1 Tax=Ladona fulva TaxID=123851 RepID=A0A8K0KIJ1_LADFU|nr:hypothetical protein J437_LFUL013055 [Ladona fulva]
MADALRPPQPINGAVPEPQQRIYSGRPENQRDPTAQHQPFRRRPAQNQRAQPAPGPSNQSSQQRRTLVVPSALPPPTRKAANVGGTISTANPADASLFSAGMSVREVVPRQTFTPSAPAAIEVAARTFSELVTDDANLSKTLLPEYVTYYTTAMLWLRILTLKEKNAQPLTVEERDLLTLVQSTSFVLPEPLLLQMRALGNIVTQTKQHLYPMLPPLPTHVIGGHGGYYGTLLPPAAGVDNSIHNLYEEIPCLGVTSYAVMRSISNDPPGPYNSLLTFQDQQPTNRLLGFRPLSHRRPEAKNLALAVGVTDAAFQSYPANTGFNLELLVAISKTLANTSTFKNTNIVFSTLSEIGAQSQTVIVRPELIPGDTTPSLVGDIRPTSLMQESESILGSGLFFCTQLMKESLAQDHSRWSLFPAIPDRPPKM